MPPLNIDLVLIAVDDIDVPFGERRAECCETTRIQSIVVI